MNGFLPAGYEVPDQSAQFVKLTLGKHKFRIVSHLITGWQFFANKEGKKTPVRRSEAEGQYTEEEMRAANAVPDNQNPEKLEGQKYFWCVIVYSYDKQRLMVLMIDKKEIIQKIVKIIENPDYGNDPTIYDLTIERTGTTRMDTKYDVIPSPPKELDPAVRQIAEEAVYDLDKIYQNGFPLPA